MNPAASCGCGHHGSRKPPEDPSCPPPVHMPIISPPCQEGGGLRVIEFYSGIGGFAAAWRRSNHGRGAGVVTHAFDVNEHANSVHCWNGGAHHVEARDICSLTPRDLDELGGDVWLASPPCQPYTRKGLRMGSEDARAGSFLSMLDALPSMKAPPRYLLVENVLGFERSETFSRLAATLEAAGYFYLGFVLNATILKIPNSRPRFYVVARRESPFSCSPKPSGTIYDGDAAGLKWLLDRFGGHLPEEMPPLSDFLDPPFIPASQGRSSADDPLCVSNAQMWKAGDVYDVLLPQSRRSCCFTRAYGEKASGGGSVICTNPAAAAALQATEGGVEDSIIAAQLEFRNAKKLARKAVDVSIRDRLMRELTPPQLVKVQRAMPQLLMRNGEKKLDPVKADEAPAITQQETVLTGKLARIVDQARSDAWADLGPCPLQALQLRHFSPSEIQRLLGFPENFSMPPDISLKLAWRLLDHRATVEVLEVFLATGTSTYRD